MVNDRVPTVPKFFVLPKGNLQVQDKTKTCVWSMFDGFSAYVESVNPLPLRRQKYSKSITPAKLMFLTRYRRQEGQSVENSSAPHLKSIVASSGLKHVPDGGVLRVQPQACATDPWKPG
jgi:hypothetical protein